MADAREKHARGTGLQADAAVNFTLGTAPYLFVQLANTSRSTTSSAPAFVISPRLNSIPPISALGECVTPVGVSSVSIQTVLILYLHPRQTTESP